jgi:RNA polymerase sigma factor (sigma-70 family)
MNEDESSLAWRIRNGDAAAEAKLVEFFSPRVRAMGLARGLSLDASRDLVQDVLIAVLRATRQGRLERDANLPAFVHGTARHLIAAEFRERARLREQAITEEIPAPESDGFEPAQLEIAAEAMRSIGVSDRDLLTAVYLHGKKPGQIARELNVSAEVVRTRKCRALKNVVEAAKKLSRKPLFTTTPQGAG